MTQFTQKTINKLAWETHLTPRQDLALSAFYLFGPLEEALHGTKCYTTMTILFHLTIKQNS